MASSPDIPEAKVPAAKPERKIDVAPEDVQLGGADTGDTSSGKRQLKRPRSAVGTGLQV